MKGRSRHACDKREPKKRGRAVAVLVCALVFSCGVRVMQSARGGRGATDAQVSQGGTAAQPDAGQTSFALPAGTQAPADGDGIVGAGTEVLERYKETQGCELVYAGYIDLFGNVWACVVTGPGWAELSVVRTDESGQTRTTTSRIDTPFRGTMGGENP